MALHVVSAGSGKSERVTVPLKPFKGFTMMVDVAKVVPSAGTTFGRVAPMVKSGTGFELNVECEAGFDSMVCMTNIGLAIMPTTSTGSRMLLLRVEPLAIFLRSDNKLHQRCGCKIAL